MHIQLSILDGLRCAVCRSRLAAIGDDKLQCTEMRCQAVFPIVNGVPVLINESNSVFAIQDFVEQQQGALREPSAESRIGLLKRKVLQFLPPISRNIKGQQNYDRLAALLNTSQGAEASKILVIGSGPEVGEGMESIAKSDTFEFLETDVAFGPKTKLICDAHDLPFEDARFDAVIAQAVLEHVADPYRCVAEIHRVLVPNGLVYAETPFMQQVHMAAYDFTRFTDLGHRRLFRAFSEIDRGISCGSGMALAWSYKYFLVSLTRSRGIRRLLTVCAHLLAFPLLCFDKYSANNPAAYDAASGFYFLGRRSEGVLSDRELVADYRGAVWAE